MDRPIPFSIYDESMSESIDVYGEQEATRFMDSQQSKLDEQSKEIERLTNLARMLREELNATQEQRDELERRIAYALL